jgi:hypothetical protein
MACCIFCHHDTRSALYTCTDKPSMQHHAACHAMQLCAAGQNRGHDWLRNCLSAVEKDRVRHKKIAITYAPCLEALRGFALGSTPRHARDKQEKEGRTRAAMSASARLESPGIIVGIMHRSTYDLWQRSAVSMACSKLEFGWPATSAASKLSEMLHLATLTWGLCLQTWA